MTRLYSFDALKVLSIYMVIVGHVLFYSFHEANNLVWQFIDVVNMPMFMFISGFFSGIPTAKGVLKRLRTLILPTLMVGMLYTFCKEIEFESFIDFYFRIIYLLTHCQSHNFIVMFHFSFMVFLLIKYLS